MRTRSGTCVVWALLGALAWATDARAQQVVIKLGSAAPEGTPWAKQIDRLRDAVHKASKGRIKIKVFGGFAKGGEKEIIRRCVRGTLQACGATIGAVASVVAPDLNVLELPYLFRDDAEADRILDGPALPTITKIMSKKGLVFAAWSENGWRGFGMREKPIRTVADLKDLKMRAQESKVHVEMYKALGASPVTIALPEVLGSLQRGVVDGYDNTELYLYAASWHKHTRHFTRTDHIYQPAILAYNKEFFDKLPADLQKILVAHSRDVTTYGRRLIRKLRQPLIKNLKAAGVNVVEISAAERAVFAKRTAKVHGKIRKTLTPEGKELLGIITRAKK